MMIYFNNNPYHIKITFRCYFKYEQIAKHPFDINNYNEFIWMYSILKASNKDFELTFDDFLEIIRKNGDKLIEFHDLFQKECERLQKENNSVFLLNNLIYEASIDEINILIKDYYKKKKTKIV